MKPEEKQASSDVDEDDSRELLKKELKFVDSAAKLTNPKLNQK